MKCVCQYSKETVQLDRIQLRLSSCRESGGGKYQVLTSKGEKNVTGTTI
jgi:hypothetical protein